MNTTWCESIKHFPNHYNFDLSNSRFTMLSYSFFVHDQIYYELKQINTPDEYIKELCKFINSKFSKMDNTHIFHKNYVKFKNKNVRLIHAKHIIPENGILHKKIKELLSKNLFNLFTKKINSMEIIKLSNKISEKTINDFFKVLGESELKENTIPHFMKRSYKNYQPKEKTTLRIKNSITRQYTNIFKYKIDLEKYNFIGKFKGKEIKFIAPAQIMVFLNKEVNDKTDLPRIITSMEYFLHNNVSKTKLLFKNKQEKYKFKLMLFKYQYLKTNSNPYIFNITSNENSFYKLCRPKLDSLFGKSNIDSIIKKIYNLPCNPQYELNEDETRTILMTIDPQNPLLKEQENPLPSKKQTKRKKIHLNLNAAQEKISKKQKTTSSSLNQEIKSAKPQIDYILCKGFSKGASFKDFFVPYNQGVFELKIEGTNFSEKVQIQYKMLQEKEEHDWRFAPFLSYLKNENSCLEGVFLDSSAMVPGTYALRITCKDHLSAEINFEVKEI